MKKLFQILVITLFFTTNSFSQQAQQLIRIHNVNSIQAMNNITSPFVGNVVFLTTESVIYQFNGSSWIPLGSDDDTNYWQTSGNSDLTSNHFLGPIECCRDLNLGTNGESKIRITFYENNLFFENLIARPIIGLDGTKGRLRISGGKEDSFDGDNGGSIDLHGNQVPSPFTGRLDLVAGSNASSQGISFYNDQQITATILDNGSFGINTTNPNSLFHIDGTFRYVDGNQANGRLLTSDANGNATWQDPYPNWYEKWALTGGNPATNPANNFVGTSDNQPITFRTNNAKNWSIETNGKLLIHNNTNIAIGDSLTLDSLANGNFNIALARQALRFNTNGNNNIGFGLRALTKNTNGDRNIAIGEATLQDQIDGNNQIAIGSFAFDAAQRGENNIGVGSYVGQQLNAAQENGANNIGLGYLSLRYIKGGDNNTGIGNFSMANITAARNNSTAIGSGTSSNPSNIVRVGTGVNSIGGQVMWTTTSDARFKENMKNDVEGLDFILNLKPVTYNLNFKNIIQNEIETQDSLFSEKRYQELYDVRHIGFLAQDVEVLADSLGFNFHGIDSPENKEDTYGIRYADFVPSLVKAIQEQQVIINNQQTIIDNQHLINTQKLNSIQELSRIIDTLEK